jgi:polyhydroxyalkanoate synthase
MDLTDLPQAQSQPDSYDRIAHARLGRLTAGLSPASLSAAYVDWAVHLWQSPGKQGELWLKAWRKAHRLALWAANAAEAFRVCIEPLPQDRRFADPRGAVAQRRVPGFLLMQQW